MIYISKHSDKYKIGSQKNIILILTLFILLFTIAYYFQTIREKKLLKTKQTFAVIKSTRNTIRGGAEIQFDLNGELIDGIFTAGSFNFLQKGDTIVIKYSKEDPTLVILVDKYYMKKYKHLKK